MKKSIRIINSKLPPFRTIADTPSGDLFWHWGDDNMLPASLLRLAQNSTVHRRIVNDKTDYIAGVGFSYTPDASALTDILSSANGEGETLRSVFRKLAFDHTLLGNAFMEVVTDAAGSFLSLFHHDASKCRLAKDGKNVLIHHDWAKFSAKEVKKLPFYPAFTKSKDGTMRSMIHFSNYEPMMPNYGAPSYIAGLNACRIANKTDLWNISRLDNSFQLSGMMILDGSVEDEGQATEIVRAAENKFSGRPGQVMFVVKESDKQENSRFVPITTASDGDWEGLHKQATSDIVIAHSWFRTLSGLDYGAGFSSERVTYEYEIAINTIILPIQEQMLEPLRTVIRDILNIDASTLGIINIPPTKSKPQYMKLWEARKDDGLDYDPQDPAQQIYLSQL